MGICGYLFSPFGPIGAKKEGFDDIFDDIFENNPCIGHLI